MFRPGRDPLEVEVFRVVNVGQHPDLRAPALSGALHRLDDGEMVEVPFVYHDPGALQFILVIPEGAEGRELTERVKLLEALIDEPSETVPSYVRHFTTVYGYDGLAERVDEAQASNIDVAELEPVDRDEPRADYFPKLAGLLPRATFVEHLATDLAALVADDELWLFARLDEESMQNFAESTTSLRLRLESVDQVPVCVLALEDWANGAVKRAFLNPERAVDAPVLEMLARDFSATAILSDPDGNMLRSFRVEAPCEANAMLILERTEGTSSAAFEVWTSAVEAVRGVVRDEAHPFELLGDAASPRETLTRLRELDEWNAPERIDHAVLRLGVPQPVVHLAKREILGDAVRYGLAMTPSLVEGAVAFGFAPDAGSLARQMVASFDQTVSSTSDHGLDEQQVEANRAALRELCELHGTSTGPNQSCTMDHSG